MRCIHVELSDKIKIRNVHSARSPAKQSHISKMDKEWLRQQTKIGKEYAQTKSNFC